MSALPMMLLHLSSLASAAPDGTLSCGNLVAALTEYRAHAPFAIPLPSASQCKTLLAGKVLKMRIPNDVGGPVGALAMVVSPLSKEELWLGSADGEHSGEQAELITHDLPLRPGQMFRWYGFVDLPRPLSDRHFLIHTTINQAVEQATEGRVWSRHWRLEDDGKATMAPIVASGAVKGLDVEVFKEAVYLPLNYGAWLFVDLPDGRTLFAYHTAMSLGGDFPDGLVNRYTYFGLDRLTELVLAQAATARGHYRGTHALIMGGNGKPVPRYR